MIAVRPPEYFPGLAYVALMQQVDCFVLADTFQYSRQRFQNRAKLRNPQGWQWITVPLQGHQHGRPICEVEINTSEPWQRKHRRAFEYNYRTTPYFEFFEDDFMPILERTWTHLGDLTCATVELLHQLMDLPTTLVRASSLEGAPDTMPSILAAMGDRELVSPPEAAVHDAKHTSALQVFRFKEPTYRQNFDGFEPGMSVTDLLFNYGPETSTLLQQEAHVEAAGP